MKFILIILLMCAISATFALPTVSISSKNTLEDIEEDYSLNNALVTAAELSRNEKILVKRFIPILTDSNDMNLSFSSIIQKITSFVDYMGFDSSGLRLLQKLYNSAFARSNLLFKRKVLNLIMQTCNFILSYLPEEPVQTNPQLYELNDPDVFGNSGDNSLDQPEAVDENLYDTNRFIFKKGLNPTFNQLGNMESVGDQLNENFIPQDPLVTKQILNKLIQLGQVQDSGQEYVAAEEEDMFASNGIPSVGIGKIPKRISNLIDFATQKPLSTMTITKSTQESTTESVTQPTMTDSSVYYLKVTKNANDKTSKADAAMKNRIVKRWLESRQKNELKKLISSYDINIRKLEIEPLAETTTQSYNKYNWNENEDDNPGKSYFDFMKSDSDIAQKFGEDEEESEDYYLERAAREDYYYPRVRRNAAEVRDKKEGGNGEKVNEKEPEVINQTQIDKTKHAFAKTSENNGDQIEGTTLDASINNTKETLKEFFKNSEKDDAQLNEKDKKMISSVEETHQGEELVVKQVVHSVNSEITGMNEESSMMYTTTKQYLKDSPHKDTNLMKDNTEQKDTKIKKDVIISHIMKIGKKLNISEKAKSLLHLSSNSSAKENKLEEVNSYNRSTQNTNDMPEGTLKFSRNKNENEKNNQLGSNRSSNDTSSKDVSREDMRNPLENTGNNVIITAEGKVGNKYNVSTYIDNAKIKNSEDNKIKSNNKKVNSGEINILEENHRNELNSVINTINDIKNSNINEDIKNNSEEITEMEKIMEEYTTKDENISSEDTTESLSYETSSDYTILIKNMGKKKNRISKREAKEFNTIMTGAGGQKLISENKDDSGLKNEVHETNQSTKGSFNILDQEINNTVPQKEDLGVKHSVEKTEMKKINLEKIITIHNVTSTTEKPLSFIVTSNVLFVKDHSNSSVDQSTTTEMYETTTEIDETLTKVANNYTSTNSTISKTTPLETTTSQNETTKEDGNKLIFDRFGVDDTNPQENIYTTTNDNDTSSIMKSAKIRTNEEVLKEDNVTSFKDADVIFSAIGQKLIKSHNGSKTLDDNNAELHPENPKIDVTITPSFEESNTIIMISNTAAPRNISNVVENNSPPGPNQITTSIPEIQTKVDTLISTQKHILELEFNEEKRAQVINIETQTEKSQNNQNNSRNVEDYEESAKNISEISAAKTQATTIEKVPKDPKEAEEHFKELHTNLETLKAEKAITKLDTPKTDHIQKIPDNNESNNGNKSAEVIMKINNLGKQNDTDNETTKEAKNNITESVDKNSRSIFKENNTQYENISKDKNYIEAQMLQEPTKVSQEKEAHANNVNSTDVANINIKPILKKGIEINDTSSDAGIMKNDENDNIQGSMSKENGTIGSISSQNYKSVESHIEIIPKKTIQTNDGSNDKLPGTETSQMSKIHNLIDNIEESITDSEDALNTNSMIVKDLDAQISELFTTVDRAMHSKTALNGSVIMKNTIIGNSASEYEALLENMFTEGKRNDNKNTNNNQVEKEEYTMKGGDEAIDAGNTNQTEDQLKMERNQFSNVNGKLEDKKQYDDKSVLQKPDIPDGKGINKSTKGTVKQEVTVDEISKGTSNISDSDVNEDDDDLKNVMDIYEHISDQLIIRVEDKLNGENSTNRRNIIIPDQTKYDFNAEEGKILDEIADELAIRLENLNDQNETIAEKITRIIKEAQNGYGYIKTNSENRNDSITEVIKAMAPQEQENDITVGSKIPSLSENTGGISDDNKSISNIDNAHKLSPSNEHNRDKNMSNNDSISASNINKNRTIVSNENQEINTDSKSNNGFAIIPEIKSSPNNEDSVNITVSGDYHNGSKVEKINSVDTAEIPLLGKKLSNLVANLMETKFHDFMKASDLPKDTLFSMMKRVEEHINFGNTSIVLIYPEGYDVKDVEKVIHRMGNDSGINKEDSEFFKDAFVITVTENKNTSGNHKKPEISIFEEGDDIIPEKTGNITHASSAVEGKTHEQTNSKSRRSIEDDTDNIDNRNFQNRKTIFGNEKNFQNITELMKNVITNINGAGQFAVTDFKKKTKKYVQVVVHKSLILQNGYDSKNFGANVGDSENENNSRNRKKRQLLTGIFSGAIQRFRQLSPSFQGFSNIQSQRFEIPIPQRNEEHIFYGHRNYNILGNTGHSEEFSNQAPQISENNDNKNVEGSLISRNNVGVTHRNLESETDHQSRSAVKETAENSEFNFLPHYERKTEFDGELNPLTFDTIENTTPNPKNGDGIIYVFKSLPYYEQKTEFKSGNKNLNSKLVDLEFQPSTQEPTFKTGYEKGDHYYNGLKQWIGLQNIDQNGKDLEFHPSTLEPTYSNTDELTSKYLPEFIRKNNFKEEEDFPPEVVPHNSEQTAASRTEGLFPYLGDLDLAEHRIMSHKMNSFQNYLNERHGNRFTFPVDLDLPDHHVDSDKILNYQKNLNYEQVDNLYENAEKTSYFQENSHTQDQNVHYSPNGVLNLKQNPDFLMNFQEGTMESTEFKDKESKELENKTPVKHIPDFTFQNFERKNDWQEIIRKKFDDYKNQLLLEATSAEKEKSSFNSDKILHINSNNKPGDYNLDYNKQKYQKENIGYVDFAPVEEKYEDKSETNRNVFYSSQNNFEQNGSVQDSIRKKFEDYKKHLLSSGVPTNNEYRLNINHAPNKQLGEQELPINHQIQKYASTTSDLNDENGNIYKSEESNNDPNQQFYGKYKEIQESIKNKFEEYKQKILLDANQKSTGQNINHSKTFVNTEKQNIDDSSPKHLYPSLGNNKKHEKEELNYWEDSIRRDFEKFKQQVLIASQSGVQNKAFVADYSNQINRAPIFLDTPKSIHNFPRPYVNSHFDIENVLADKAKKESDYIRKGQGNLDPSEENDFSNLKHNLCGQRHNQAKFEPINVTKLFEEQKFGSISNLQKYPKYGINNKNIINKDAENVRFKPTADTYIGSQSFLENKQNLKFPGHMSVKEGIEGAFVQQFDSNLQFKPASEFKNVGFKQSSGTYSIKIDEYEPPNVLSFDPTILNKLNPQNSKIKVDESAILSTNSEENKNNKDFRDPKLEEDQKFTTIVEESIDEDQNNIENIEPNNEFIEEVQVMKTPDAKIESIHYKIKLLETEDTEPKFSIGSRFKEEENPGPNYVYYDIILDPTSAKDLFPNVELDQEKETIHRYNNSSNANVFPSYNRKQSIEMNKIDNQELLSQYQEIFKKHENQQQSFQNPIEKAVIDVNKNDSNYSPINLQKNNFFTRANSKFSTYLQEKNVSTFPEKPSFNKITANENVGRKNYTNSVPTQFRGNTKYMSTGFAAYPKQDNFQKQFEVIENDKNKGGQELLKNGQQNSEGILEGTDLISESDPEKIEAIHYLIKLVPEIKSSIETKSKATLPDILEGTDVVNIPESGKFEGVHYAINFGNTKNEENPKGNVKKIQDWNVIENKKVEENRKIDTPTVYPEKFKIGTEDNFAAKQDNYLSNKKEAITTQEADLNNSQHEYVRLTSTPLLKEEEELPPGSPKILEGTDVITQIKSEHVQGIHYYIKLDDPKVNQSDLNNHELNILEGVDVIKEPETRRPEGVHYVIKLDPDIEEKPAFTTIIPKNENANNMEVVTDKYIHGEEKVNQYLIKLEHKDQDTKSQSDLNTESLPHEFESEGKNQYDDYPKILEGTDVVIESGMLQPEGVHYKINLGTYDDTNVKLSKKDDNNVSDIIEGTDVIVQSEPSRPVGIHYMINFGEGSESSENATKKDIAGSNILDGTDLIMQPEIRRPEGIHYKINLGSIKDEAIKEDIFESTDLVSQNVPKPEIKSQGLHYIINLGPTTEITQKNVSSEISNMTYDVVGFNNEMRSENGELLNKVFIENLKQEIPKFEDINNNVISDKGVIVMGSDGDINIQQFTPGILKNGEVIDDDTGSAIFPLSGEPGLVIDPSAFINTGEDEVEDVIQGFEVIQETESKDNNNTDNNAEDHTNSQAKIEVLNKIDMPDVVRSTFSTISVGLRENLTMGSLTHTTETDDIKITNDLSQQNLPVNALNFNTEILNQYNIPSGVLSSLQKQNLPFDIFNRNSFSDGNEGIALNNLEVDNAMISTIIDNNDENLNNNHWNKNKNKFSNRGDVFDYSDSEEDVPIITQQVLTTSGNIRNYKKTKLVSSVISLGLDDKYVENGHKHEKLQEFGEKRNGLNRNLNIVNEEKHIGYYNSPYSASIDESNKDKVTGQNEDELHKTIPTLKVDDNGGKTEGVRIKLDDGSDDMRVNERSEFKSSDVNSITSSVNENTINNNFGEGAIDFRFALDPDNGNMHVENNLQQTTTQNSNSEQIREDGLKMIRNYILSKINDEPAGEIEENFIKEIHNLNNNKQHISQNENILSQFSLKENAQNLSNDENINKFSKSVEGSVNESQNIGDVPMSSGKSSVDNGKIISTSQQLPNILKAENDDILLNKVIQELEKHKSLENEEFITNGLDVLYFIKSPTSEESTDEGKPNGASDKILPNFQEPNHIDNFNKINEERKPVINHSSKIGLTKEDLETTNSKQTLPKLLPKVKYSLKALIPPHELKENSKGEMQELSIGPKIIDESSEDLKTYINIEIPQHNGSLSKKGVGTTEKTLSDKAEMVNTIISKPTIKNKNTERDEIDFQSHLYSLQKAIQPEVFINNPTIVGKYSTDIANEPQKFNIKLPLIPIRTVESSNAGIPEKEVNSDYLGAQIPTVSPQKQDNYVINKINQQQLRIRLPIVPKSIVEETQKSLSDDGAQYHSKSSENEDFNQIRQNSIKHIENEGNTEYNEDLNNNQNGEVIDFGKHLLTLQTVLQPQVNSKYEDVPTTNIENENKSKKLLNSKVKQKQLRVKLPIIPLERTSIGDNDNFEGDDANVQAIFQAQLESLKAAIQRRAIRQLQNDQLATDQLSAKSKDHEIREA